MKKAQAQAIVKLLEGIDLDIQAEDIRDFETVDDIADFLEDNDYFNVEIIYYARAMEYLAKHDTSLRESLEIASEMGYDLKDLSSETLASLLASQNARNDFDELRAEIEEVLE